MPSHHAWVPIRVARFESESADQYQRRRDEIERIVTGFRMGRYADVEAERMERRLALLRDKADQPASARQR